MAIPLKYNIGNLTARRVSTLMTVLGIGVVIAVMLAMMALENGVAKATMSTGSKDNLMVLREGAAAEISSWVNFEKFQILRGLPGVAKSRDGQPMISPELVIAFKIPKRDDPKGSNVTVRGVTPMAFEMRPYIRIIQGRLFRRGVNEVIVARRIRDRFVNTNVGDTLSFGPQKWVVVGVFEGNGTAFDSEIWTDVGYLGLAHKRNAYSSVLVRPVDHAAFESIKAAIKGDNRLKLQTKTEYKYYEEQMAGILGIKILVGIVTFFMIIGAILGTMNAMFSAISSRKRELATMRALGFKRRAILAAVIVEAAFIAFLGGVAGLLLAIPVNGISTGTVNWSTFSELAFNFRIDAGVAIRGIILAVISGVVGGLIPAVSAARLPITRALREI